MGIMTGKQILNYIPIYVTIKSNIKIMYKNCLYISQDATETFLDI